MIRKIDGLKPKPVIVVLFFQVINLSLRFRSAANFLKIYPEQRIRTSPLTHVESDAIEDFRLCTSGTQGFTTRLTVKATQAIDPLLAQP
jgi:hypothetical protein